MSRPALLAMLAVLGGCGTEPPPRPETRLGLARAVHTATALAGARVLIAGGCVTDGCGTATDTTELYDDRARRFAPGPRLTGPRAGHTATPLPDGRMLLAGGYAGEGQDALATAETCDARGCRATGSLMHGRGGHAAAPLPAAACSSRRHRRGDANAAGLDRALRPADGPHLPGPSLRTARYKRGDGAGPEILDVPRGRSVEVPGRVAGAFATATPLGGGRTLVAGGYDDRIAVSDVAFVVVE